MNSCACPLIILNDVLAAVNSAASIFLTGIPAPHVCTVYYYNGNVNHTSPSHHDLNWDSRLALKLITLSVEG